MIISFLKRLFSSYYGNRLDILRNEFLEETEKDKLLAAFAEWLLPLHEYFEKNCIIEDRWVAVDKYQFSEVYEMDMTYCLGMRIFWS